MLYLAFEPKWAQNAMLGQPHVGAIPDANPRPVELKQCELFDSCCARLKPVSVFCSNASSRTPSKSTRTFSTVGRQKVVFAQRF